MNVKWGAEPKAFIKIQWGLHRDGLFVSDKKDDDNDTNYDEVGDNVDKWWYDIDDEDNHDNDDDYDDDGVNDNGILLYIDNKETIW